MASGPQLCWKEAELDREFGRRTAYASRPGGWKSKVILPSRDYSDAEEFVEDFLSSLTPAVISRSDFIQWDVIEQKVAQLGVALEFYAELRDRSETTADLSRELIDSLLSCDEPLPYLRCAFELLGHTNDEIATNRDDVNIQKIACAIEGKHEESVERIVELLCDLV